MLGGHYDHVGDGDEGVEGGRGGGSLSDEDEFGDGIGGEADALR